jgi:hypothetical protein
VDFVWFLSEMLALKKFCKFKISWINSALYGKYFMLLLSCWRNDHCEHKYFSCIWLGEFSCLKSCRIHCFCYKVCNWASIPNMPDSEAASKSWPAGWSGRFRTSVSHSPCSTHVRVWTFPGELPVNYGFVHIWCFSSLLSLKDCSLQSVAQL